MESFLEVLCALDAKCLTCHWWSRNRAARLPDGSGGQQVKRALRLALLLVLSLAGMAQAQDRHYKPNPRLTPGDALNVTADDLCKPGHAEIEGKTPVQVKRQVFDRYGIRGNLVGYNVDHLIPPELGGSSSIKNIWPQPLAGEWTYHMKNLLERRLLKLVCSGALDLKIAQQEIARDWIGTYKKYVSAPGQVRSSRSTRATIWATWRARSSSGSTTVSGASTDSSSGSRRSSRGTDMIAIRDGFIFVFLALLLAGYALLALVLLARALAGLVRHRHNEAVAPAGEREDVTLNDTPYAITLSHEAIPSYGSCQRQSVVGR